MRALMLAFCLLLSPLALAGTVLENAQWHVQIDPATLALRVTPAGEAPVQASSGVTAHAVTELQADAEHINWQWDNGAYHLSARLEQRDLALSISAREPGELHLLRQPAEAIGKGLIWPLAEGHYVPAGNAVVIDHGDGWETQYSHLQRGSVAVRPGQRVAAGERIGLIGLSGNSEFPHLHFAVRHRGQAIDPFTGGAADASCIATGAPSGLWAPAAALQLGYRPTAVIAAGLASAVPAKAVTERDPPPRLAGRDAPLILWVDAMGAKAGDRQSFAIAGPDGAIVHSQEGVVAGGGLSWFAYSGKRAPPGGWTTGHYTGRYILRRGPDIVATFEAEGVIE